MSEYIIELPDDRAEAEFVAKMGMEGCRIYGYRLVGEIVRCHDCIHWATHARFTGKCIGIQFNPHGFCAWGERKKS